MTRQEMIEAMDIACDSYRFCSGNPNGDCPLHRKDPMATCIVTNPEHFTDMEIETAYNTMFKTSTEEIACCSSCKHNDKEADQEPCVNCQNNFVSGTLAYESHKLLWESPNSNPVTHPSHYNQGNIECIDAMVAAFGKEATAIFCHINAFKYLWRTEHKNGLQDIDKAIWYLNKYKELKASGE